MMRLSWLPSTPSTQDVAVEAARAGEPALAVATTDQGGGRGRRGREWTCPPGSGLAVSVLVRPRRQDAWTVLPLLAGVAVVDALAGLGAPDAVLKWPNDVLARGGKVAGILADRVTDPSPPAVVLGIGVNVRDVGLPPGAVAAENLLATGPPDAASVADAVLEHLVRRLRGWEESDGTLTAYRERCSTLGRTVEVHLPGGEVLSGRATGVDADGRLVVDTGHGVVAVSAGDVVHVRDDTSGHGRAL